MPKRTHNSPSNKSSCCKAVSKRRTSCKTAAESTIDDEGDEAVNLVEIDLTGHGFTAPSQLDDYLTSLKPIRQHLESSKTKNTSCDWLVRTDSFPAGCMSVLIDHVHKTGQHARIVEFHHEYGNVKKYALQNPDLKLLLKSHGRWLKTLRMSPIRSEAGHAPPPPKLQGCGYRWTALHAQNLEILEISLKFDIKNQLLDLTRRTPLRLGKLRELTLRDAGLENDTRVMQLSLLVSNAQIAELLRLVILGETKVTEGGRNRSDHNKSVNSLASLLIRKAKAAGNNKLSIEIFP